ncbi:YHS domain-containing (seleno)protein [Algibacter mikhailovii]|uniref:YHS domain-containing (seleno)protein n=1 Tax=Algibacter mikhailovii TaxID=425498 RepID=UPI0024944125|nr:YHS domain-containing (seleno)protein [Algibacter mikhailovii]
MKNIFLLFALTCLSATAQDIDYNLKKGFIANGFDVVAYFDNKTAEGLEKYTVSFDGANYKFSSEKNQEKFNKNPSKYVPKYGGYCAYAIAKKSEKVSIDPETFLIDDGNLYLFYNSWGTNTLKLWQKNNEATLIELANANWEKIKLKK